MNLGKYNEGQLEVPEAPVVPTQQPVVDQTPKEGIPPRTDSPVSEITGSTTRTSRPDPPEQTPPRQKPATVLEEQEEPTQPVTVADSPFRASSRNSPPNSVGSGGAKKQGDLIVLGGSLRKSRSSDSADTRNSNRNSNRNSSRNKAATAAAAGAVVGAGVAGGAVYVAAQNNNNGGGEALTATKGDPALTSTGTIGASTEYFHDDAQSLRIVNKTSSLQNVPNDEEATSNSDNLKKSFASPMDDANKATEVNHNFNGAAQPRSARILGMSRPVFMGAAFLAAGAAGVAAWTAVEVPSLNSQVRDLERQVDRLSEQVDILESENARFNESNNMLNNSIQFLNEQNDQLNATSHRLNASVFQLEDEIEELNHEVARLENVTADIKVENDKLNTTVIELTGIATDLNNTVNDLNARNQELNETQQQLASNITRLKNANDALNQTNQELANTRDDLQNQNDLLEQNLDDLNNVTLFINETIQGNNVQIALAANSVSNLVDQRRALGIEHTHILYQQAFHNWDCDLADIYAPFFQDLERDIVHPDELTDILDDMNHAAGLVNQICLNNTDYNTYLQDEFNMYQSNMNMKEMMEGTNRYSHFALDYMFPNPGEPGMTAAEWEAAGYVCGNFTRFQCSMNPNC